MAFEGFADEKRTFFKALAKHQDRDWFLAHKEEFETGWNQPMGELLGDVRSAIDGAYPHCELGDPHVFRIYRDVRFSKDKSPYKTHLGGHVSIKRSAKSADVPVAVYFHLGDTELLAAAGYYMMDSPTLARFRAAVAEDKRGQEVTKLLARLEKKGFVSGAHDTLTRVPKGFDPGHPRADLLKRKGLIVSFPPVPKELLTSRKLVAWLASQAKTAAPLVEWLVFATA